MPALEYEIRQKINELCDFAGASPKEVESLYQQLLDSFREYRHASPKSAELENLMSTPAGAMADDITERLQCMNRTLQAGNERAAASLDLLARSTRKLAEMNAMYQAFSAVIGQSKALMREVSSLDCDDRRKVQAAFAVLLAIVAYVFVKRAPVPAFVWPWNWIQLLFWLFRRPDHHRTAAS